MDTACLNQTISLYRPIGPGQLQAILDSGSRRFPDRKTNQKFFYPLLHEAFAHFIARHWQLRNSGVGYVTMFEVRQSFVQDLPIFRMGGPEHQEYRIEAQSLPCLNDNIVGKISVIAVYKQDKAAVNREQFGALVAN
ncbi:ADP-ribosylation/crystallin J1 [Ketobacter sp. MCCC 1A13808]|uniref:ADP-ribosylation/crystallin J1 n=1 Tax=Ketobacter sp. MCCC 1A13808 TaxID=2602738 RepID=UPI000F18F37B|nr:ADP-ribosylation/crystallin J1 [Ketobacter sp. MCCC 1A13808]MVF11783.1 ADP-ribosylation/crystallin J1 [Ketobacter sp. MCCC 1A13808]RLP55390.1 MAG: ADP-ribosylation/crystallin J1 [Ketobacter sp.]